MFKYRAVWFFIGFWLCCGAFVLVMKYFDGKNYQNVELIDCSGDKFKPDDGDSFFCEGKYVRVMGIDTPETAHPDHGIDKDQPYGKQATILADKILMNAKTITLVVIKNKDDKYDRILAHVLVDNKLFAPMMISSGLAYETISEYGDSGFAGYAGQIINAWNNAPKPEFMNPHDWREENQEKD